MRRHLSTQLSLLVIGLIILPFALLFACSLKHYERVIQSELSQRIVAEVRHSNDELNRVFEKMVNLSSIFANDADFDLEFTSNLGASYYDHYMVFAGVLRSIELQNLYDDMLAEVTIHFRDNNGQWYSNQPFSPEEQRALEESSWFEQGMNNHGFVVWNQQGGISYVRELYGIDGNVQPLGTMVVSINQAFLWKILASYGDISDSQVFATDGNGQLLIYDPEIGRKEQLEALGDLEEGHRIVKLGDTSYLAIVFFLASDGMARNMTFKVCYLYSWEHIRRQSATMVRASVFLFIIFLIASLVIASLITRWVSRPIQKLSGQMRHFLVGNSVPDTPVTRSDEIGDIELSFRQMAKNTNELFAHLKQEHREREHYYYASITARLNPHFLFNTLHTMRWMAVIRKADNIRQCIDALTSILQYHLSDQSTTTLHEELTVLESYAFIQTARYGDRISYSHQVPEELYGAKILKFSLQPIVENCWKHAFPPDQSSCHIVVKAAREGEKLFIDVMDDGQGFSAEAKERFLSHKETTHGKGSGIGLFSIDQMIILVFGKPYGVSLVDVPAGSCVRITLPYQEGNA